MLNYLWPLGLVVLSNVVYQICTKSVPEGMDPFASLTVTYAVGALFSVVLFFIFHPGENLLAEYKHLNWAPVVLGIVIVGLEIGYIYAYKAGWPVSALAIVQSSVLAVALLVLGKFAYQEAITWNKLVGIIICLIGLGFINYKR